MFKQLQENIQMKKLVTLIAIALLAACTYSKNSINFIPERNKVFTLWQTDKIFYYDKSLNDEFLSESKLVTESKMERGQVLITHAGEEMVSSRTYRTDYYSTESVKPTHNGEMDSAYSPVRIRKNGHYTAFGEVTHNGETYMLVHPGKSKDVLLVKGNGELYEHIGRIVDGRLAVLSPVFYITPDDLKMVPVVHTRVETSGDDNGYHLIYEGLDNNGNDVIFTLKENGASQQVRFSICDERINIRGMDIDIFDVSEKKIEYMIR